MKYQRINQCQYYIPSKWANYLNVYYSIMKEQTNEKLIIRTTQEICQQYLQFFVQTAPLNQASFPILNLTYSLWRQAAYNKCQRAFQSLDHSQYDYHFFQSSEKHYLAEFITRIQNEMSLYCRGMKDVKSEFKGLDKFTSDEEQMYGLMVELGESVWEQQLYLQLIEDLIYLPYLDVIPKKSKLVVRGEYATGYITPRKNDKFIDRVANSVGKTFFSKTLASVTEILFSKTFVLKVNTVIGSFNPIVMGATFGLSRYLKHLDEKKKQEELEGQLKLALQFIKQKVLELKSIYYKSLNEIRKKLSKEFQEVQSDEEISKRLRNLFLRVYEEQWLQIETIHEEDGWEVVNLVEKESFQDMSDLQ